jgi:hypothetical protein
MSGLSNDAVAEPNMLASVALKTMSDPLCDGATNIVPVPSAVWISSFESVTPLPKRCWITMR